MLELVCARTTSLRLREYTDKVKKMKVGVVVKVMGEKGCVKDGGGGRRVGAG